MLPGRAYEAFATYPSPLCLSDCLRTNPDSFEHCGAAVSHSVTRLVLRITAFSCPRDPSPPPASSARSDRKCLSRRRRQRPGTRCFRKPRPVPDYAEVYDNLLVSLHYYDRRRRCRSSRPTWNGPVRFAHRHDGRGSPDYYPCSIALVSRSMHARDDALLRPLWKRTSTARRFRDVCLQRRRLVLAARDAGSWRRCSITGTSFAPSSDDELAASIRNPQARRAGGSRRPRARQSLACVDAATIPRSDLRGSITSTRPALRHSIFSSATASPSLKQVRSDSRSEAARLDPSRLCYAAPPNVPDVLRATRFANGFVTFGSFNRLSKIAEPLLDLWAAFSNRCPTAVGPQERRLRAFHYTTGLSSTILRPGIVADRDRSAALIRSFRHAAGVLGRRRRARHVPLQWRPHDL